MNPPRQRLTALFLLAMLFAICALAREARTGRYPLQVIAALGADAWSGKLRAITFAPVSAEAGTPAPSDTWEAGDLLSGTPDRAARTPASRTLWTTRDANATTTLPSGTFAHIAFRWDSLSDTQRQIFSHTPDGTADSLGETRIAYLRGDRRMEPDPAWRKRAGILGATRGITPLVIGPPSLLFTSGSQFAFGRDHQQRAPVVIAGANDGMLHVFDLATGEERFGYVPGALLPWLATTPHPQAVRRPPVCPHPAAADAQLSGQWRTVLVCDTGGGIAGLFAWDLTDTDNPQQHGLQWEVTGQDITDLGYTTGPVQIVALPTTGQTGIANPDGRQWFAISGNGRAAELPTQSSAESSATSERLRKPALLLFALNHRQGQPWHLGIDYWKLDTPAGASGGLGAPAVVTDVLGKPVAAYAGDTAGTLWRFDLRGPLPWPDANQRATAVFHATSQTGHLLDLSQRPILLHAAGGTMVIAAGNAVSGTAGSVFGFLDRGSNAPLDRASLAPVTVNTGANSVSVTPGPSRDAGWLLDLPGGNESPLRLDAIGVGQVRLLTASGDESARQYLLNGLTGGASDASGRTGLPVTGNTIATPVIGLAPGAPVLRNAQGWTAERVHVASWQPDPANPSRWVRTDSVSLTVRTGRLSWRELSTGDH